MKITHIRIHNVLGIESLEIKPGAITEIKGRNGAGKTSVLSALRAVFEGGKDGTLLRKGEKKGEIVLILDDGTEVERTITEDSSTLTVTHPELGRISRPQTYLDKLTDALSVNPILFLTAPEKKRAEYLLESIPLSVTSQQIKEATGFTIQVDESEHAFDVLESLRSQLYEDRTGVNRAAKEKKATISQLAESIPQDWDPNTDWSYQLQVDESSLNALQEDLKRERDAVEEAWRSAKEEIHKDLHERINTLNAEMQKKIDEIKDVFQKEKLIAEAARASKLEEIDQTAATARDYVNQKLLPYIEASAAEVARDRERERESIRVKNTIDIQQKQQQELTKLEERSERLTKALSGLQQLKTQLVDNLPIPGLEVREGAIFKDGIPYDRLPESIKVWIAVELAKLRAGKLGLVSVDGLERLDKITFREFERLALHSGLQFIIAKVSDDPFTVETINEPEKEPLLLTE
jgi:DNA repair exonuclease SbcCD ATPase subunit